MKTTYKVFIAIILYALTLAGLYWGADYYIEAKVQEHQENAYNRFNDFFGYQEKFVDTEFNNTKVYYSQKSIPQKPTFNSNMIERWESNYGDLYSYYEINSGGWALFTAHKIDSRSMYVANLYPSAIGLRGLSYGFTPSVEYYVNEAYDFWTKNPSSQYYDFYNRGYRIRVENFIRTLPNKYFDWCIAENMSSGNYENFTYMYSSFYKVFLGRKNYSYYEIERQYDVINKDKEETFIFGGVILTLILLLFLIPIIVKHSRKEKRKKVDQKVLDIRSNESLYDKLVRSCNPAKFMEPYDKEKVEKANSIYKELLDTEHDNIETLRVLRQRATDELDISFVDTEYLEDLKSKCNPAQFLDPYSPDKVAIANELYQRLIDNENNIEVLEEIEDEIKNKLI